MTYDDGDVAWRKHVHFILGHGAPVAPRGQLTREVLHTKYIQVDLNRPVVTSPTRKLNYRFMCAEALWILNGDNKLAPLTRFVKRMAKFSDDGETLYGAYGPRILPQLGYVVSTLRADRDTRQATLTIWRENPSPSKDLPCTVAMGFSIRDGKLHQHVFMRSSDAWLGIPYDIFSFACVGIFVACSLNQLADKKHPLVGLGALTISMTSAHLYERDVTKARQVLASPVPNAIKPVPSVSLAMGDWDQLHSDLLLQRENESTTCWQVVP